MSPSNFHDRHQTMTEQARRVIASQNFTPEQLEAAILDQGALVEFHTFFGRMRPAREAAKVVLQLNMMRPLEIVEKIDPPKEKDR